MRVTKTITKWLAHPLTKGLDIDSPQTSLLRQRIIKEKKFLCKLYKEWYSRIIAALPAGKGKVLELGSGGGFFREMMPEIVTSDVFLVVGINDIVARGEALPFCDASFRAIVMINVFHHIPDVESFLLEAARVLHCGGRLILIEPWNTCWARFVYSHIHHEPFNSYASKWAFPRGGPLSAANAALPWMVFNRDRHLLEERMGFRIITNKLFMPITYLLSGGVSMRSLCPGCCYSLTRKLEKLLPKKWCAMFGFIVCEKINAKINSLKE